MKAKRVRFKDSETEPNHPASCRFGDSSAACEAREDLPKPPAASSSEPKTSEFLFFKKLKQDVGRSYGQNPQNRKSLPVRNVGPSNHSRDLGDLKFKDVKSSQSVKKPTTGEIKSFFSPKEDAALEISATPVPNKELDSGRFKSSSLVKTPGISLDMLLSTTANGSVNTESQQRDGDIFSCKRQRLLQQIAKTLFPDADEVPKECNLVLLLLKRLIPESSQETLSQNKQLRQPETKEKCQLHLDSNVQLKEASYTGRLRMADDDHFLDSNVPVAQSRRFFEPPSSCQTVIGNDAFAARYSDRMLGHKEWNEQGSSLDLIAYECWPKNEDRNLLTWGDELYDYSTAGNTSPNFLKNEAYKQFSCNAYDRNWSCRFRDHYYPNEVLDRSYDSFAAAESNSLVYKDGILDLKMDRAQSGPDTWCDSSSHVFLEDFRPFASSNPRDYTEGNCLNGFEIRTETCPRLIGWNTDEVNVHDSTQTTNMEIEVYHPPSITCSRNPQDNPERELYSPQSSTWSGDHYVSPEKRNLLRLSPYTYHDHDTQEQHLQRNGLVPRSPCIPLKLLYGPEQLNSDDSVLSLSRGSSFFYIPKMDSWSVCERIPAKEAFSRLESECSSINGSLNEQYNTCSGNAVELFRPEHSKSQFLIADENDHSISQPERRSMTSVHVPLGQEDLYPLQFHTLMWKETEAETCDCDRGTTSTSDSLFW